MGIKYINNTGVVGNKFTVGEAVIGEHAVHSGYYGLWNTEAIVTTTQQYMIISSGTDTYINGDEVFIRAGNNSSTNQVNLSTSGGLTVGGNRVLTVADEGSGNGLDADTLDGRQGSLYREDNGGELPSTTNLNTLTTTGIWAQNSNAQTSTANNYPSGAGFAGIIENINDPGNTYHTSQMYFRYNANNEIFHRYRYDTTGGTGGWSAWAEIWTSRSDGSGSGLDADTVDGIEGASFLRSDAADTATGQLFFDAGFDSHPIMLSGAQNFDNIDRSGFYNLYNTHNSSTNSPGFHYGTMIAIGNDKGSSGFGLQIAHERTGAGMYVRGMNDSGSTWYDWDEIWTSGTHGSGSGLDADTLDSYEASAFPRKAEDAAITGNYDFSGTGLKLSSHFYTRRYDANGNVYFHVGTADSVANILNLRVYDASNAVKTLVLNGGTGAISWNGNTILTTADEGSGNGLDADTVDGVHASAIVHGSNTSGTNEGTITNWNSVDKSGFYSDDNASNSWTTGWTSIINHRLYDNDNNYHSQIGFGTYGSEMYYRGKHGAVNGWSSWQRIFMDDYHPNADEWTTARTITFSGDVTGSFTTSGASDSSCTLTVANDSHTHDGRYYTETESDSRFVNVTGDTMTGDLTVEGNLTIGEDGTTPLLDMMFTDHTNGQPGWDTRIQMGKSDDFAAGTAVFPTYVPAGAYGVQFQANSDGVFFGMEEYTTGHFRPIIQWGDDNDDTPFRIKHENGSEFTVSYNGIATATTRLSAPTLYSTVATGTAPLTVTSTTLVSNLNADLLDGLDSDIFFKSQTNDNGGWSQSNRNFSVRSGGNSVGLHMEESDGTFGFQIYGDGSNYGFLDGEWANWDLKKITNGEFYVDAGSGLQKVWHEGNDGTGSGLDADTVDGLEVHTGTNNEANKIVRTQANGYIHAGWINTTSGSSSADISRIYASNDGYIRYYTPSNFLNGGGIAEDLFNNQTRDHNAVTNFNDTGLRAGVNYIQGGTNSPTGTGQWYGFRLGLGGNYGTITGTSGHYASELYWSRKGQTSNNYYIYTRDLENGTWGSWIKMYAGKADAWTTARTITLAGDLSGSVSIDGSANVTLTATVADDSHDLTWDNIDGETANSVNDWGGLRHQTNDGYIDFGPANTSWAHIYTDRPAFYTNKDIYVNNSRLLRVNNEGSGGGIDADTVDALHASSFLRSDTTNSLYRVTAGDGNRIRFWDSDSYAIWMSSATNSTWGGRVPGETTSDYNMYFRMSAGTNRGFVFQNSTTEVAGIDASGNIRAIADVIAYSSSDKTFKDELSIIENPLDKIKNINGYNFTWNNKQTTYESGKKDIGVVAQEIEKVLPEIVNTREDGSKAVKYDKIVALLIEGIKELKDEVEELKKKCNDCTK